MASPRKPDIGRMLLPELRQQVPLQPIKSLGVQQGPRPGWAARLFGGADPLQQGLLSVEDTRGLGRSALLNAGLNILANSGPQPYQRGLGEILASGALAGQQAYQQGAQGLLGQQNILSQRQRQAQLSAIGQRYQGRMDLPSLQSMLGELLTGGFVEEARPLAEYLKSQQERRADYDYVQGAIDPQGRRATAVIEPGRGTDPIGYIPEAQEDRRLPGYLTPQGRAARLELERELAKIQGPRSPSERLRLQGLQELVSLADDITAPGGLLESQPQGVGLSRILPDLVNQRLDPGGIALRSTISNLKTTIRQLRSGAAVTEHEATQLEGMLPDRGDSPEAVRWKVEVLRVNLERMIARAQGIPTDQLNAGEDDGYPKEE